MLFPKSGGAACAKVWPNDSQMEDETMTSLGTVPNGVLPADDAWRETMPEDVFPGDPDTTCSYGFNLARQPMDAYAYDPPAIDD